MLAYVLNFTPFSHQATLFLHKVWLLREVVTQGLNDLSKFGSSFPSGNCNWGATRLLSCSVTLLSALRWFHSAKHGPGQRTDSAKTASYLLLPASCPSHVWLVYWHKHPSGAKAAAGASCALIQLMPLQQCKSSSCSLAESSSFGCL